MAKENAYRETFPLNKTYKVSLFSQLYFVIFCVTEVMEKTTPLVIRLSYILFFPPSETNQSYTFSTIIKSFWW